MHAPYQAGVKFQAGTTVPLLYKSLGRVGALDCCLKNALAFLCLREVNGWPFASGIGCHCLLALAPLTTTANSCLCAALVLLPSDAKFSFGLPSNLPVSYFCLCFSLMLP